MQNRNLMESRSGFSVAQVDEVDENGNIVSTSYAVVDPDGNVKGRFGTFKEAQDLFEKVVPQEPTSPPLGQECNFISNRFWDARL